MFVVIQPGIYHANTDKMATNIIIFTLTDNGLRIYPSILTKNKTTHGTTPGKFSTKSFVIILVCNHLFKNLQVTIIKNLHKYHKTDHPGFPGNAVLVRLENDLLVSMPKTYVYAHSPRCRF